MTRVENEVAFGLENLGVAPDADLAAGARRRSPRSERRISRSAARWSSRVVSCSASASHRRSPSSPQLLLLDEPTSQLDPAGAAAFLAAVERARCAVVLSEQRVDRALCDCRSRDPDGGRTNRPRRSGGGGTLVARGSEARGTQAARAGRILPAVVVSSSPLVRLEAVRFAYGDGPEILGGRSLVVHRGEIVALEGANGSGKTTLAKVAAGLLEPTQGTVVREGRATYLSQDPGRYLVRETAIEEVALGVGGDENRARGGARGVRAHVRDGPPSARPLERGARAARNCGRLRARAGPARPRRADARDRPRSEGRARRVDARAGGERAGSARRHARPSPARASPRAAGRTGGGAGCGLGSPS